MEALILRFDAPLMSFGGVMVDQHNVTDRFPGHSLIAGLLANALGWTHGDADRIQQLQDRVLVASRWDIPGEPLLDYHTVDLGQPKMREKGWTTRGEPEHRNGGDEARLGTHIRYRHYWSNGVLTSAVSLSDTGSTTLGEVENALRRPARPLFIGRKTCLPSTPILVGRRTGTDVLAILKAEPRAARGGKPADLGMPACWPAGLADSDSESVRTVYDQRDWHNHWHSGSRPVAEGIIPEVKPSAHD